MGLFSQDCIKCGHPALSTFAITKGVNDWMTRVVCITPKGAIHVGQYDGYGRVDGCDNAVGYDNTVYHLSCWKVAGRPNEYRGPSPHSMDQGYFFEDGKHDMTDPILDQLARDHAPHP